MHVGCYLCRNATSTRYRAAGFSVAVPGWGDSPPEGAEPGMLAPWKLARGFHKGAHAPSFVGQACVVWINQGVDVFQVGNEGDNPFEEYRRPDGAIFTVVDYAAWAEQVAVSADRLVQPSQRAEYRA